MTTSSHPNAEALTAEWADDKDPTKQELLALVEALKKDGDLKGAQDLEVVIGQRFQGPQGPPAILPR